MGQCTPCGKPAPTAAGRPPSDSGEPAQPGSNAAAGPARLPRERTEPIAGLPARQPASPLSDRGQLAPRQSKLASSAVRRWHGLVAANNMVRSDKFTQVRKQFGNPGPGRRLGTNGPSVLKALSDLNLERLRAELPLNTKETDFFNAVMAVPWFLTHATPKTLLAEDAQTLRLASNHHLVSAMGPRRGDRPLPPNLERNQHDIERLGNGHYVFLSLEAGEDPKKTTSRFGGVMYRIPLNERQLGGETVLMLNDALVPPENEPLAENYDEYGGQGEMEHQAYWQSSGLKDRPGIGQPQASTPSRPKLYSEMTFDHSPVSEGEVDEEHRPFEVPDRCIFQGDKALEALAFAVIASSRRLGDDQISSALLATDADSINMAVHSLFTPQVMVPHALVTATAEERALANSPRSSES